MGHRSNDLRNPRRNRLRGRANATVMHQGSATRQDFAEGQIVKVPNVSGKLPGQLLGMLRQQNAAPFKQTASLDALEKELIGVLHCRARGENDWGTACLEKIFQGSRQIFVIASFVLVALMAWLGWLAIDRRRVLSPAP